MKKNELCKHCGECGYFMRYKHVNGIRENVGDCANLTMNKECNDSKVDPFTPFGRDEGLQILQVDENETSCTLFRIGRTERVRRLLKAYSEYYE